MNDMNPLLSTVGTKIVVSHSRQVSAADGMACYGDSATVIAVGQHTFIAECACGWKFSGMRTDRYRAP